MIKFSARKGGRVVFSSICGEPSLSLLPSGSVGWRIHFHGVIRPAKGFQISSEAAPLALDVIGERNQQIFEIF
jgi:hypothetical protein